MERIRSGVYCHYKGQEYDVYGETILSGTEDSKQIWFVIYRPRYGQRRLTSRLKTEFTESVSVGGVLVQRFVFVRELESPELKVVSEFFSG